MELMRKTARADGRKAYWLRVGLRLQGHSREAGAAEFEEGTGGAHAPASGKGSDGTTAPWGHTSRGVYIHVRQKRYKC